MKAPDIVARLEEILESLPKNEIDVQVVLRYGGSDRLVGRYLRGVELLQKLKTEIVQNTEEK